MCCCVVCLLCLLLVCESVLFGHAELSLQDNTITRIQNLSHLTKLRVLDLSNNAIERIEGLDALHNIESLNLTGNQIRTLSPAIRRLQRLRTLHLARNKLANVSCAVFSVCVLRYVVHIDCVFYNNSFAIWFDYNH